MKRTLLVLSIIILSFFISFNISNNTKKSITIDNLNYYENNQEETRKMYIEVMEGSIKNKYTKDNPLYLTVGETITYHMAFTEEEYPQMKLLAESTIYSGFEGSLPSNIMGKTMNDTFFDEYNGIRFAYRANVPGECRVIIKNKNNNEIYETIYVKVVNANLTQFKDPLTGNEVNNPNNVNVDVGTEVEFYAVLSGDLVMDGDLPSTQNFVGSGFWSWDVTVNNEWTQLENHKWLTKYKITTQGPRQFTIGLGRNGNGQLSSTVVNVIHNKIEVDNINMGTISYSHINKNIATKMLNGFNKGDNSQYNRYIVPVAESITVNAPMEEEYSFSLSNTNTMKMTKETSYKNGIISATFTGLNPGDNEILLKNQNGEILEIFYIQVRYPLYVDTFMGEISKDCVHEYLDAALNSFYNSHPDAVISNPIGLPQYVKNGTDYYMKYYLFGEYSVKVVSYVKDTDNNDFQIEGNLEMKNHKIETITEGEKAGFKRISGEFIVTVPETEGQVKIGNDTFVIAQRTANERIHHFDIETTDGGQFTKNEITNYSNGTIVIEESVYKTKIIDIHGSTVYAKENNILVEIPKNQYWVTNVDNSTQFESTSAYITNEDGHLIDRYGNVIDDLYKAGLIQPQLKNRNILLNEIDKVDFYIDLDLIPDKKIIKTYKKQEDGTKKLISTKNEVVNINDIEHLKNYTLSMNHTQIVDAYNKCPFHNGLDFTIKVVMQKETNSNIDKNENSILTNPSTGALGLLFITIILLITKLFTYYRLKKKNI